MLYLERKPSPPLNTVVRLLWYTRAPVISHARERILPNGCTQLVINLARDFLSEVHADGTSERTSSALLVGSRSTYEVVDTSDMAELAGVVLEPGAMPCFARDAADQFSHRSIPLEDVWGKRSQLLRDRLLEADTPAQTLFILEQQLRNLWNPAAQPHPLVRYALDQFNNAPAASSVANIAAQTGWTARRFSQVFREQVGLAPKVWCRLLRFQQAVRRLHAAKDVRWAELALDCGYYDQSHFANDFRSFSGIDPTTYSARRGRWSNHVPL